MTTFVRLDEMTKPAPRPQRGRAAQIALWTLQIGVAAMFLFAGSLKLSGDPQMIATFDAVGLGQWFRYVTGGIEVVAAGALLVPSLAVFGALLLIPTMIGAVATHLFIVGGPPTPAVVLLVAATVIAWVRRHELIGAPQEPVATTPASRHEEAAA